MNRVLTFIANNWVSWVIELTILGVVGMITIGEVRKTNEQTREMLSAISAFAADRQEAVGDAIDSIAGEAQNIEIEGKVDINTLGSKAKEMWDNRKQEEDLEED